MQTPAPFEYTRATSLENALATLQAVGGDARVVAGGHGRHPPGFLMRDRRCKAGAMVWIAMRPDPLDDPAPIAASKED